ncbi:response regulator transcription factor [Nocardioides lijunqiniae]|uniref:response regulator transcription factor n=1 Tax=Nocardioides lijunqiniae TaxID=2760832 RepID=UPI001877BEDE|nr:response regulator transcription factor [Nocardioides lijunqiniae]
MSERPTAVVVDDATVIRQSIPALMPAFDIVGSYPRVEALIAERPHADLVILDLHLVNSTQPSARQGVAAVRAVVAAGYRACVYSQEERRFVLAACLAAGATGIVSKSEPVESAQSMFLDAMAGQIVVPQAIISLMELLVRRNCITILGERQRQVLAGRARGLTYAELSRSLFLSESTLRGYWRELTLGVSRYLQETTPSDIERALGLGPGDLLDFWPGSATEPAGDSASRDWWHLR